MKSDLASFKNELKKEFKRLTDVGNLKSELNRLASEIRGFDLSVALAPAQRTRLEKRYRELKKTLTDLQTRLDSSFAMVSSLIRRSGGKTTTKSASRKKSTRGPTASKRRTTKKTVKKTKRATK